MAEGAMIAMAPCGRCGAVFAFDPEEVPSVAYDTATRDFVPAGTPVPADGDGAGWPQTWVNVPLCDPCADAAEEGAKVLGIYPLWPRREAAKVAAARHAQRPSQRGHR